MKRVFLLAMIILLSGCSLFTSEDLHNDTEKEAMETFLTGVFAEDSDAVSKLSLMDEEKQTKIMNTAKAEKLSGADADACVFEEMGDLHHYTICKTTDAENVAFDIELAEDKKGFFVQKAAMKPAVDFVFRQDRPELTEEYVANVENIIEDKLQEMNDDEKQEASFRTHHIADAVAAYFNGHPEALTEFIDLDQFIAQDDTPITTEEELLEELEKVQPETSSTWAVDAIEFGSFYDNLEILFLRNAENYERQKDLLEDLHFIDFHVVDTNGDENYVQGMFHSEKEELELVTLYVRDYSSFNSIAYDMKPEDEMPTTVSADDTEELYQTNCAACHASDLQGSVGPDLRQIYEKYTADEITEIILEGKDSMPPARVEEYEAEAISNWLVEQENE